MKVVEQFGPRQVRLAERDDPEPFEDFVVVKIEVSPTCTEYKGYPSDCRSDQFGHEATGEVAAVAQPGRVKVGDRVVVMPLYPCGGCALCLAGEYIHCRNGIDVQQRTGRTSGAATYAQYLLKQDWLCVPIPEGMRYEHAAMACCGLGPTFGAMQRMNVGALDTVLITGMGPVGLGGVINAAYRGARVIAVEGNAYRADLARRLGAAMVLDPDQADLLQRILDFTEGGGVDKAVDCSGSAAAQRLLLDAARPRGQVSLVGEGGDLTLRVSGDMIRKGLALHGVWHYNLADTPRILQVIRDSGPKLDMLITHTFPMGRVGEAWDLQLTGNCGKVLLQPWA